MYLPLNQYHVVMEVAPQFQQTPEALRNIYLRATNGSPIPLSAFTHFAPSNTPLAVNHQGQVPSATISFNLAPGVSLGQATDAIEDAERSIGFPPSIRASFQGTAAAFEDSKSNMLVLIMAALAAVYIVWACCTRATSTPLRFCRQFRRQVWEPYWRCFSPTMS
jgi:multidrug efflux pump